ncbi:MAG: tetratricopeptide repeat protein, partial [Bacteroidota bacterium]
MNISPSFARDAAEHLRDGNIQHAADLCLLGTKAFPNYSTGHFILGKCHEAFGRTADALAAYRQALSKLPDNPTLQTLVKNAEETQQKEFQKFVEEQEKRFADKI